MHGLFHAIFPAQRQRGSSPFVLEEHAEMIEGGGPESVLETDTVLSTSKVY